MDVPVVPCAGPMIQTRRETGPELGTGPTLISTLNQC